MKKSTPFFAILFLLTGSGLIQAQNFQWAAKHGGSGNETGLSVVTDASGNVYSTGGFEGTVDFDPGPGEWILTSAGYRDIYIAKHSPAGSLLWVKQIGGDKDDLGNSIAIDGSGNILTTGFFKDTVDFDPGAGAFTLLTPLGFYSITGTFILKGSDVFISKLDSDGNFIWAKQIGGNLANFGAGIAIDGSDNVYTVGEFSVFVAADSADFDPGPGVHNLGTGGAFISKLDADGNFGWAKQFGWNDSGGSICGAGGCNYYKYYTVSLRSVDLDGSNNVYTSGSFHVTNDFDPGAGVFNMTAIGSNDALVLKLDNTGGFAWAKQMGGSGANAHAEDIAVDGTGNVHTTGNYSGKVDFNPGSGVANLTSSNPPGTHDIFVSKLNSSGNYSWAKSVGAGGEDYGLSIALDAQSNVYYTGYFNSKVDFDPGSAKYNLTGISNDIFISKLTAAGNFSWARSIGNSGDDKGYCVTVDGSNSVVTTGNFSGTVDFDPNTGTYNLTSSGGKDAFVVKLSPSAAFKEITSRSIISPEISVFPNPAHDFVNIEFDATSAENFEILIRDGSGKIVRLAKGNTEIGKNVQNIPLENTVPGLYHIQIILGNECCVKSIVLE